MNGKKEIYEDNPSEPGILSSMKTPTSVNPFLMKVIGAVMDNSLEESVAKQILDWIESFRFAEWFADDAEQEYN